MKHEITLEFPDKKSLDMFREALEEKEGDIMVGFGNCIQIASAETYLIPERVNKEHYILERFKDEV